MASALLRFQDVSKRFESSGHSSRLILNHISFALQPGCSVAITGRSGSGKSTLLHLAAGIDLPTTGRILVHNEDLTQMGDAQRTLLRRNHIGLVFQFFHLLGHLSVLDNIVLPEWIAGASPQGYLEKARHLLERVGLTDRAADPVQNLSGGEMQRVAICRALIRRPALLLADEPTGNLDDENGWRVLELLMELAQQEGSSLVYVTHSAELAAKADQVWRLHSGILET